MPERGPHPTDANPAPSASPDVLAAEPSFLTKPSDDLPFDIGTADSSIELGDRPYELSIVSDGDDDDAPAPRSRKRRIVLAAILAAGLAGVGVLGWASWQITSEKDATITPPPQIAGLRLDTSQSGQDTATYLENALSAEVSLDKAVGAVYTDGSGKDMLFFGGTSLIWSPSKDLTTAFNLISDDQGAVTGLHDVETGTYGGTMKCGTTKTDDGAMSVCGWADHGSIASAMFPNRPEPDAAKILLDLRNTAQKRN